MTPDPTRRPASAHTCGGCSNTWTGYSRAHCSVCHRTFGGVKGFDRHRAQGVCRDPQKLGLILGSRGVWVEPFHGEWWGDYETNPATDHTHHNINGT